MTSSIDITRKFAELYVSMDGDVNMQEVIDTAYGRYLSHMYLPSMQDHENYMKVYRGLIEGMEDD